jgi:hypothetical protein
MLRGFVLGLALVGGVAMAAEPLTKLSVVALSTAANQELELPLVGPAAGEGTLGTTYRVQWTRDGDRFTVRATREDEGKYWRLALQARFAAQGAQLRLGYGDTIVPLALSAVEKPGQFYWFWENGRPSWVLMSGAEPAVAVAPETSTHHGFFLIRETSGETLAQFALDAWQPGESAEIALRVLRDEAALALCRPPVPADLPPSRLGRGLVQVNAVGDGFVTPDGKPWSAMGRNLWTLPTRPAAEQEATLRGMAAAGMTVTRIGLADCVYRPQPGVFNDGALRQLRQTLDRCAAHGLRVIICLEYSGCAYQYNNSSHLSPVWSDLYLLPECRQWYAEMVQRVVKPLRDHPAVLAWGVTNEPMIEPDDRSVLQAARFREWLQRRYETPARLAEAWGEAGLTDFAQAKLPSKDAFEKQQTPAARDFFRWSNEALGTALIDRARLVRAADPGHLLTLSHGNPRLLAGLPGAEVFDFWAPHTYDLWCNGPVIADHVLLLEGLFAHALPDRARPVVIEEFGIREEPKYPEAMRAQHIRQFRAAVQRYGLAGLMHWWEMSPALEAVNAEPVTPRWAPQPSRTMAVYFPPSQEWKWLVYAPYMERRLWGAALSWAVAQGLRPRFVRTAPEAAGAEGVLVLGTALAEDEKQAVRALNRPVYLLPGGESLTAAFPGAQVLPDLELGKRVE